MRRTTGPVITGATPGDWYDLITGTKFTAVENMQLEIAAHGIGGLLHVAAGADVPDGLADLLAACRDRSTIADADGRASARHGHRHCGGGRQTHSPERSSSRRVGTTCPYRARVRETGLRYAPTYPPGTWKPLPPQLHGEFNGTMVHMTRGAAVDAAEVTNAEFARFLAETGYRPDLDNRFLAHWVDGRPARETEDEPVTFVDLDDASAYAAWRGARLPTEPEWQLAAADPGFRRLEPLVWNWTGPAYRDGRSRWTMIKGGSAYAAEGSDWYFDGGPRDPDWVARLLLLGGGLSRSATIGFRCAVDLDPAEPEPVDSAWWTELGGG